MTPTEAIRHLGTLSAYANADEVKAVEMAIEALGGIKPSMTIAQWQEKLDSISQIPMYITKTPLGNGVLAEAAPSAPRLTRNAIECKACGDVIESWHEHDYKQCKCLSCAVDGGLVQLRRSGDERSYIERSEWA